MASDMIERTATVTPTTEHECPRAGVHERQSLVRGEVVLPFRAYLREDHRHGPFAIGPAYAVDVAQPGTA